MVMMFYFNDQKGLTRIHNWVENRLEVCLMEDHLIETHVVDHCLIHMLDFMNGQHLIQEPPWYPPIVVQFEPTGQ
jgi:hypothetical protein